ncbi:MAG: aldolase/citrate lyase family protein [Rhodobacteraceae bacterium]|nr:aldolase/citrate lyase family protein [Paracoccaceae bacterium]
MQMRILRERDNPLKQLLAADRPAIGIWCSLASALTTEIVAGSGADWLLIDGEHSPNDLRSVVAQLQAAGAWPGCEPVVRLPSDDPVLVKQFLDAGARSLMVPNVRSADQARALVAAMRYAPEGFRGFSVAHRANGFGRVRDYHATCQQRQLLAVQIECAAGVAAAAAIAAVPGVDVLFVGPGDLSTNLGHMGDPGAAPVRAAIAAVADAARAAGKAAGILAPVREEAERCLAGGFRMVAVGSDLGLLARGSDALVAQFRPE